LPQIGQSGVVLIYSSSVLRAQMGVQMGVTSSGSGLAAHALEAHRHPEPR